MAPSDPLPIELPWMPVLDDATAETVRQAQRRLAEDADDADALFVLGVVYDILGEAGTALRFMDRLTEISPEYPGAWRAKARMYRRLGDEEKAAMCEENAVEDEE